jgi:purine-binding chemotaxis protein CheW
MSAVCSPSLLCEVGVRLLAVPLECVVETMRPLAVELLPGMPDFILGMSVIRGSVVPVVDVPSVLGVAGSTPRRFVTISVDGRTAALAVDTVLGIQTLDDEMLQAAPALLSAMDHELLSVVGTWGARLLLVLSTAHLVPESVWASLDGTKSS